MSKRFIYVLAGIGVLLAIILGYGVFFKKPNVVKPKVGPIVEAIYALGTVKSDDIYILKLGITSGITQLFVNEGDVVQKGQKLIVTESSTLTSPISGTVTRIYLDKGETVMPGIPVLTVMDLTKTFIQISLDQSSALRIKKGQKAELSFENLRGTKINGTVQKIYPSDGQFLVRLETEALPSGILPGMTADVAIEVARREDAMLVPVSSIHRGQIRILRDGKIKTLSVKIGAVNGELAEVQDGQILEEDEILIGKGK